MSTLTHKSEGNILIVALDKQLGLDTTAEVRDYLKPLLENWELKGLIFNCEKLDYITSSGIGFIADYFKQMKGRGLPFALVEVNSKVSEVFRLTGFARHINMMETEAKAIESFNNKE